MSVNHPPDRNIELVHAHIKRGAKEKRAKAQKLDWLSKTPPLYER
jgi:hypothetical protein